MVAGCLFVLFYFENGDRKCNVSHLSCVCAASVKRHSRRRRTLFSDHASVQMLETRVLSRVRQLLVWRQHLFVWDSLPPDCLFVCLFVDRPKINLGLKWSSGFTSPLQVAPSRWVFANVFQPADGCIWVTVICCHHEGMLRTSVMANLPNDGFWHYVIRLLSAQRLQSSGSESEQHHIQTDRQTDMVLTG